MILSFSSGISPNLSAGGRVITIIHYGLTSPLPLPSSQKYSKALKARVGGKTEAWGSTEQILHRTRVFWELLQYPIADKSQKMIAMATYFCACAVKIMDIMFKMKFRCGWLMRNLKSSICGLSKHSIKSWGS